MQPPKDYITYRFSKNENGKGNNFPRMRMVKETNFPRVRMVKKTKLGAVDSEW